MYICLCNAVTESDIRAAVDSGVVNLKQLGKMTGCTRACGCCEDLAAEALEKALAEKMEVQSLFPTMQPA